jgi:nitrous oxidase accessory protein NosD
MYPQENMPNIFTVVNNQVNLFDGATGIVGWNNKDALIRANKFKGNGKVGISLDADATVGLYASGNKYLGNHFSSVENSEADIVLGANTKNNLVVGSPKDDIDDLGVDNKIITSWK